MATGFEALGAASAVLQVIAFASDVVVACKKVYDGKPTADNDLENYAKQMSDVVGRVETRCQEMARFQPAQVNQKLEDIAKGCKSAAQELEKEVRFVTSMHEKANILKAMHATLRSSHHRKKIEKLEVSLLRYKQLLETEMMAHICSRTDAIALNQSQEFNDLAGDVQQLITNIAQGHTRLEELIERQHNLTGNTIKEATAKTEQGIKEHTATQFQTLRAEAAIEEKCNSFLKSLKPKGMNKRYGAILPSSQASFQRVFASYNRLKAIESEDNESEITWSSNSYISDSSDSRSTIDTSDIDHHWSLFVEWLQSNDQLFSIQGKPGSGKSTLVKFIVDNHATEALLHKWNPETVIISHFFWKIGATHQNSIKGLYCSLVYRSLHGRQDLVQDILQRFEHLNWKTEYDDWSTADLKAVLSWIWDRSQQHFCVFIDGLDEINKDDGFLELTRTIDDILKYPIKLCVSSRPEAPIVRWLEKKQAPGILLEDLTRPDMWDFVRDTIASSTSKSDISAYDELTRRVVRKAEGVFLWLYLVTRSLITGIENDDTEDTLLCRLDELPGELEQLYADMWQRLNENNSVYRKTASRYFRYALQHSSPIYKFKTSRSAIPNHLFSPFPLIFHIACAENIDAQQTFLKKSGTMKFTEMQLLNNQAIRSINERCAGLLQIRQPILPTETDKIKFRPDFPGENGGLDALLGSVEFIHRTAHDFLRDTEAGQRILDYGSVSDLEIETRLFKGLLCCLCACYSGWGIEGDAMYVFRQIASLSTSRASGALQNAVELLPVVQDLYEKSCITYQWFSWQPEPPFLSNLMIYAQFDDFVVSILRNRTTPELATRILREAWFPDRQYYPHPKRTLSARVADALVSAGADPHDYGVCYTDIDSMLPFARQGSAFTNLLTVLTMSREEDARFPDSDRGHFPDSCTKTLWRQEALQVALTMAATCPNLDVRVLMVGAITATRGLDVCTINHLGGSYLNIIEHGRLWVVFEVNIQFLLLHLLSESNNELLEKLLSKSAVQSLLPAFGNPSIEIRCSISRDEGTAMAKGNLVCHRFLSKAQKTSPNIAERLFRMSLKKDEDQPVSERQTCLDLVDGLITDSDAELVSLESEILSLAHKELGFDTLTNVGIVPDPTYLETDASKDQISSIFPSIMEKLTQAAQQKAICKI